MGVTGDEPEEALDLVEAGSIGWRECASLDFGRDSSLDACGRVVAKDEMDVKLGRQIGFDVPLQRHGTAGDCAVKNFVSDRTPCPLKAEGPAESPRIPGFPLAKNRHYAIK
ncbi:hypothetical protein [Bradyrhizobium sp. CW10]|uniref:hypothetical protein n=1 Tax=Bradyrhizobium sp. CW10 TaxID=2782683 RepID=UPI001FFBD5BC|nr:hypothetical protein [Bradyrhizobium sp. CW10]MCK1471136.1 hypothetical protein [Bradyrhizobium sp. CW10]